MEEAQTGVNILTTELEAARKRVKWLEKSVREKEKSAGSTSHSGAKGISRQCLVSACSNATVVPSTAANATSSQGRHIVFATCTKVVFTSSLSSANNDSTCKRFPGSASKSSVDVPVSDPKGITSDGAPSSSKKTSVDVSTEGTTNESAPG